MMRRDEVFTTYAMICCDVFLLCIVFVNKGRLTRANVLSAAVDHACEDQELDGREESGGVRRGAERRPQSPERRRGAR